MKQRSELDRRVDKTLESLDGIERASPAPWLFTRVKARMNREERTPWSIVSGFLSRPAVTIAGLCLILVLNASLLFNKSRNAQPSVPVVHIEPVSDSESLIASSSSFDYENLVQP